MSLLRRVAKLESNESFAGTQSAMDRFSAALDYTALRMTRRRFDAIDGDAAPSGQFWRRSSGN